MDSTNYVEWIGACAGILTTVSFFPQAYKVYKTGNTTAISLRMFVIFTVGLVVWLLYGFLLSKPSIIYANLATLLPALYILYKKATETTTRL